MIALANATANRIPLPDDSIHCVVTSPPYWGLRDYGLPPRVWGDAWRGCLGLEPTPEMYVKHIVEVFREIRRVLRGDGTVWLNLGDSYARSGGRQGGGNRGLLHMEGKQRRMTSIPPGTNLKEKDLVGIPWRVAFALQADGWWLRRDIIWFKTNPMPESVRDRPAGSHEYVFLLSKSARYFYDAEAVRETATCNRMRGTAGWSHVPNGGDNSGLAHYPNTGHRNRRSVWMIATKPYKGAHFATYPPALVEPCIKAGTSERGVCAECGAPWERVTEKKFVPQEDVSAAKGIRGHDGTKKQLFDGWDGFPRGTNEIATAGWRPSCAHYLGTDLWQEYPRQGKDENDDDYSQCMEPIRLERQRLLALWKPMETVPATVLDPFVGSGTTLLVARQLGRSGVGLDLSEDYLSWQARKRLELDKLEAWEHGDNSSSESLLTGLPLFERLTEELVP